METSDRKCSLRGFPQEQRTFIRTRESSDMRTQVHLRFTHDGPLLLDGPANLILLLNSDMKTFCLSFLASGVTALTFTFAPKRSCSLDVSYTNGSNNGN